LKTKLRSHASPEPESDPLNETIRVYNDTHQNISKTARLLSVSRNTVYKRLKNADVIK
jgi:DNA-binding PucR family transcriptional regulator